MAEEMQLQGVEEVLARLKFLPPELARGPLVYAMRQGAKVVQQTAIRNAEFIDSSASPDRRIFANIAVQVATRYNKRTGDVMVRVGVLGGAKRHGKTAGKGNPGGDTWYWRLVEFGVPSRGIVARPFMLPALELNVQNATEVVGKSLDKAIDRLVAKRAKAGLGSI